jgi:hypothetical protein
MDVSSTKICLDTSILVKSIVGQREYMIFITENICEKLDAIKGETNCAASVAHDLIIFNCLGE